MSSDSNSKTDQNISFDDFKAEVIKDYRIGVESREASLLGRREVLTGKAKFGIFGDGKEVAQLAMAKVFRNGDFRSGYYRDQTFMMAIDALSIQEHFAALYAHPDIDIEPASGGRQMGGHFATQSLTEDGTWKELTAQKNSSADISPTAGQMARLVGLAQASKVYRNNEALSDRTQFSKKGNEIAFGTIGNASTSEGVFFEAINAIGVLQVPVVMSVWDDEYGISVPAKYQTTKENISEILKGFQLDETGSGFEILKVEGWNYPALVETYQKAERIAREEHVPVLIHVVEVTQPQGHSTSGSHERYKSPERLQWEKDNDCLLKMKQWMLESAIATEEELETIEKESVKAVRVAKSEAWKAFLAPIKDECSKAIELIRQCANESGQKAFINKIADDLDAMMDPIRRGIHHSIRRTLWLSRGEHTEARATLQQFLDVERQKNSDRYNSHLYSESAFSARKVEPVNAEYEGNKEAVDGRMVLRNNFDRILSERPDVLIFGEDSGKIGDVNQGLEGLQDKHGESRVFDTGIRESTIVGQGIGMAMRGLRPIAEIQYLDYLLYALQTMSDDLATLQYRTKGRQKAPLIIRTRGHRLEGIWHSGSPMGMIVHACRGINVLVPRDMTRAAGFYNTLLDSDEPGLIVECLNGYRLKENMPSNLAEIRTPVGVPEVIAEGTDVTLVTYGSNCRIALEAAKYIGELGISIEIIDVQSLVPFDLDHMIVEHLKNTNRVVFLDEDVPGGASAYMMQKVLEEQGGYYHLDSEPVTIASKEHRPAYGSDGDYFSKPSVDDVVEAVYGLMREADPVKFPEL
ncbi:MAG: transketolase [Flavobacteriales bacterium]|nr:transketolase [Flavobacteriales bacterium]